jgi:peptidoglycan hydrolase-like protein with peptidoglycan-binding domain
VPTSQNGYTANDRSVIRSATIAGTDVKVAVRTGPAGDLLLYAAARWHREVEPLRAPDGVLDCWGYAERLIRGSSTELSNHASGTALDLRARAHPLGTPTARTYTAAQIAAAHRIIDDCQGALRWGGDYANPARGGVAGARVDSMHVEANAPEARCAQVLAHLTGGGGTPTPSGIYCQYDDRSDHVMTLQRFMTSHFPAYNRYRPTGYFGIATKEGVAEFQRRTGLTPDGVVGPMTLAKLQTFGFKP